MFTSAERKDCSALGPGPSSIMRTIRVAESDGTFRWGWDHGADFGCPGLNSCDTIPPMHTQMWVCFFESLQNFSKTFTHFESFSKFHCCCPLG